MPEFVNISVGSLRGTSGLEATTVCPLDAKKSRKDLRISATVTGGLALELMGRSVTKEGLEGRSAPCAASGVPARGQEAAHAHLRKPCWNRAGILASPRSKGR